MKLQHITKLISKNITTISIASAFVLGAVGLSDMSSKYFDTSSWFQASETAANSVEAVEVVEESAIPETVIVTSAETEVKITVTEETTIATEATTIATTEATTEETTVETTTVATSETSSAKVEEPKETTVAPTENAEPKETTVAPTTEKAPETEAPAPLGDTSGTYYDDMAKAVLDLVNAERAANGLAPLSWSNTMKKDAAIRATEIVVCWSHTRPDGSPWYAAGSGKSMGENLAFGQSSAEEVVAAWMNSPTHASNILCDGYSSMGVSCYYCNGTYYWAQEFA